jgi:hypothetical protein
MQGPCNNYMMYHHSVKMILIIANNIMSINLVEYIYIFALETFFISF